MRELNEKEREVGRKLAQFFDMPGFPKNSEAVIGTAIAYSQFVHNKLPQDISSKLTPSDQSDLDWLCDQIYSRFEFFPRPIKARELYEIRFPPADGLSAADLSPDSGRGVTG